jgi:hypothetical protein
MVAPSDADGPEGRKGERVSEDRSEAPAEAPADFEAWALRLQLLAELRALAGEEPDGAEQLDWRPSQP